MGSEVGEGRSATVEFDNCSTTNQDEAGVSGYQDRQWERAQSQILGPHGIPVSEHILSEVLPPSSINSSLPHPGSNQPTSSRTISWIQLQSPLASAPFNKSPESQSMRLPRVFTSFPRHIGAADLAYLQSRDALTLPSEALQLELLKAYIEFVHCSMPILDLEDFLSAVKYGSISQDGQRGRGIERENALKKQIPFLLFQAVMFAGVGFVSMSALRDAGYHSRETARRMFFSRVRVRSQLSKSSQFLLTHTKAMLRLRHLHRPTINNPSPPPHDNTYRTSCTRLERLLALAWPCDISFVQPRIKPRPLSPKLEFTQEASRTTYLVDSIHAGPNTSAQRFRSMGARSADTKGGLRRPDARIGRFRSWR